MPITPKARPCDSSFPGVQDSSGVCWGPGYPKKGTPLLSSREANAKCECTPHRWKQSIGTASSKVPGQIVSSGRMPLSISPANPLEADDGHQPGSANVSIT